MDKTRQATSYALLGAELWYLAGPRVAETLARISDRCGGLETGTQRKGIIETKREWWTHLRTEVNPPLATELSWTAVAPSPLMPALGP